MTSSKPLLKPCWCNQQPPELFTRWRSINSGPAEALYHWVECNGTPPCETGENHKEPDVAVKAWNKRRKK